MNAFRYGWHGEKDASDSFSASFERCVREPLGWREELYAAARDVANEAKNRHIWVCFSGGIDGEIACRAFFDQGIHFSVITAVYAKNINEHDIAFARKWCAARGIEQHLYQVDIEKFIDEDIDAYIAQSYVADHASYFLQLRLLEEVEALGGFAVLGNGTQTFYLDESRKDVNISDIRIEVGVWRATLSEWCKRNNTSHEPLFFFRTPELTLSYLKEPVVEFAFAHADIFRHPSNTYLLKRFVYGTAFPDVEGRLKYDGFEKIRKHVHAKRDELRKLLGKADQHYRISVPNLIEQLSPTNTNA